MSYRQPRAAVVVNGTTIECKEISVSASKDHKSDHFKACAPLFHLPAGTDSNFFSTVVDCTAQVMIDIGQGSVKIFDGKIDCVTHDFTKGEFEFSGRDKGSKLIDKKSSKKFNNQKPHEIVKTLASDAGLETDVDDVDDKSGRIMEIDYVGLQHRSDDWTAIQKLAEVHDREAYMTNGKVYFKKPDEKLPTFAVHFTPPTAQSPADSNVVRLSVERSLNLGKNIKHTVHSRHHKHKKNYEGTYTEKGSGDTVEWHHHHPGLDKDQATKRAKSHCNKVTKHELKITIEMPGDPTVTPRHMIDLTGTGTAYDQQHAIECIEHKLSVEHGYSMTISTTTKSKNRGKAAKSGAGGGSSSGGGRSAPASGQPS